MDIARKEDGSYDPMQQREDFILAAGRLHGHLAQIDLTDPEKFRPATDGDIAISVNCSFVMQVDCTLNLKDQDEILSRNVEDTIQALLELAIDGIDYSNGRFVITDAPIAQLIGSSPLSGEDNEKENGTKEESNNT